MCTVYYQNAGNECRHDVVLGEQAKSHRSRNAKKMPRRLRCVKVSYYWYISTQVFGSPDQSDRKRTLALAAFRVTKS